MSTPSYTVRTMWSETSATGIFSTIRPATKAMSTTAMPAATRPMSSPGMLPMQPSTTASSHPAERSRPCRADIPRCSRGCITPRPPRHNPRCRARFHPGKCTDGVIRRLPNVRLPVVGGDLGDQLLENGVGKGLVALRRDHEGPGAADHAVVIIAVEIGLERQNWQAVDADAGGDGLVARHGHRASAVVGAVAGDVDDAPAAAKRAFREEGGCIIDGAADRGAAAEQLARHTLDRGGKRTRALLIADPRPSDHVHLQHGPGPLHHGDRDRLVRPGADRVEHTRMAECRDITALLQLETIL